MNRSVTDSERSVVDPHHHLWFWPAERLQTLGPPEDEVSRYVRSGFRAHPRYLFDELMTDLKSVPDVQATVFMQCRAMYRSDGPEAMRSLGEVEFANGVAAMAASGVFGNVKACAGIVGFVNLTLEDGIDRILGAHIDAGGGRYRGIRQGPPGGDGLNVPHLLLDTQFRAGFRWLSEFGLSFDTFLRTPELLGELIDLARAFPETQIILDHLGSPPHVTDERYPRWRDDLRTLSTCENVMVKLGGLRHRPPGAPPFAAEQLAAEWSPYLHDCIEIFGATRCMFESDFPASAGLATYSTIWNAFKIVSAGFSKDERMALFSGTARRVYRLLA